MHIDFLIGAIVGSGVAIFFGRAPAHRLLAVVQERLKSERRRR